MSLWESLAPEVGLFMAYHLEKPLAGALAVPFGRGAYDLYAATADQERDAGASYLLTWHMITHYAGLGYRFYDLGGIEPEAGEPDPRKGLHYFKSRFGGERLDFVGEFDLVLNPAEYRLWGWWQPVQTAYGRLRDRFSRVIRNYG